MLSIEKIKELLKDKNIPDQEAEEIRDECRNLAEIVFEKWQTDKRVNSHLYKKKNQDNIK